MATTSVQLTSEEWYAEAEKRYGSSWETVKFKCPSCGFVQSIADFQKLGMPPREIATKIGFSCVGRWMEHCQEAFTGGPGPCNYAGGGLIRLNPVAVNLRGKVFEYFDFADQPLCGQE